MRLLMGLILPSGIGTGTLHKLENIQIWKEESYLRPAPTGRAPIRLISTLSASLTHVPFVKLTQTCVQTRTSIKLQYDLDILAHFRAQQM